MPRFLIALLVFVPLSAGAAPIYRCATGGSITYQEMPCAGMGVRTDIPESYPEVNKTERDRLLQREAALDARLLKRAEIEAGERVARESRRARELELAAERERAQPIEPVYVVPVISRPHRPLRPYRHGALLPRY